MSQSSFDFPSSEDDSQSEEPQAHEASYAWKRHTADERALLKAINQEEANNLSLHLYNVHAVKVNQYDRNQSRAVLGRHKHQWLTQGADGVPWTPPQSWTAWPMSATEVPRAEERHGNLQQMISSDDETRPERNWRLDTDLREELLALILRKARVQLLDLMPKNKKPVLDAKTGEIVSPVKLEITVDDDRAAQILSPEVDAIISRFDDLLLALHKSQQGQLMEVHPHDLQKRTRPKKHREFSQRPHIEIDDEDERTAAPQARLASTKLASRDWSEVLGIASMASYNPEIIQRASTRCQALFAETMTWSTVSTCTDPS